MNALVIGCGSIGRRHAANLKFLGIKETALCDLDPSRLKAMSEELEVGPVFTDYKVAINESGADAVFICTPNSLHIPIALEALQSGKNIFMEKPISHDAQGVMQLIDLVAEKDAIAMMGMCYRFHPGLLKVKELVSSGTIGKIYTALMWGGHYLPYWHPWADYRKEYSAQKRLGGGVILDSIHSLDTMRWVLGEAQEVACLYDKASDLEIDTEDIASMIFRLESGATAEVHLDYINKRNTSLFILVGEKGNIEWDYSRNTVRVYRADNKEWEEFSYEFETNDMYIAETNYFLSCLKDSVKPDIDLVEGWRTLQLALAAKRSSEERRIIKPSEVLLGE